MPFTLPGFLTDWSRRKHLVVVLCVFLPLFFGAYLAKIKPDKHPSGDAPHYLAGAYNMVHHGVYSNHLYGDAPIPEAERPPAYAWFLSLGMRYLPALQHADYGWFHTDRKARLDPAFVQLKYMQLVLLLLTAGLSAWLVLSITGKLSYAHWALWLVAFNPVMQRYVDRLYSETFGIFLVTLYSSAFYYALRKRRAWPFLVPGLLLGGVTLTFTQWKLMMPFVVGSVVVYALYDKERRRSLLAGALLLLIGFQCVVVPWRMRNEEVMHRNYVSGRGGVILQLRTNYDKMDAASYACSFFYWSYGLPRVLMKAVVDEKYYAYLDRENPEGARQTAMAEIRRRTEAYGGDAAKADKELIRDCVHWIVTHPVRHLLVSLPVLLRTTQDPTFSVLNWLVFIALYYALWQSVRRRDFPTACLLLVTVPLIAFNALATHGLPRYSWQIIPLLWVGALAGLNIYRQRRAAPVDVDSAAG